MTPLFVQESRAGGTPAVRGGHLACAECGGNAAAPVRFVDAMS